MACKVQSKSHLSLSNVCVVGEKAKKEWFFCGFLLEWFGGSKLSHFQFIMETASVRSASLIALDCGISQKLIFLYYTYACSVRVYSILKLNLKSIVEFENNLNRIHVASMCSVYVY